MALSYPEWVSVYDTLTETDRHRIIQHSRTLSDPPSFLIVPLLRGDDPDDWWRAGVSSVVAQLYPHWWIAVPQGLLSALGVQPPDDRVIEVRPPGPEPALDRRMFLARAMEEAAGGAFDFVVPLPLGAQLNERALYEFAAASPSSVVQVMYADEDNLDESGQRCGPEFKTGIDPELMLGRDAVGLPVAYRFELLLSLGGLHSGVGPIGVAFHDMALRAAQIVRFEAFMHVPVVLCHRATVPGFGPTWDAGAAQTAVRRHLHAVGETATIVRPAQLAPHWCRVEHLLPDPLPLVSVIVPTRDKADLLARCADGLLSRTDYANIELIIVDNGSVSSHALAVLDELSADRRVRVLRRPGPFNYSALNNAAAAEAKGDVLVLLNNDVDVLSPGWLREMVAHAVRPDIGAVGAKLLYPDGRVQHAGVVLTPRPLISHQLRLSPRRDPGPRGELALTRTILAVTGACLALRRSLFWEVGGLDEGLQVAFNDVDLCLRLGDYGYRNVWTPFAELVHLESASRGPDRDDREREARCLAELSIIQRRWRPELRSDPFHNPNVLFDWDATVLSAPPRRVPPWLS